MHDFCSLFAAEVIFINGGNMKSFSDFIDSALSVFEDNETSFNYKMQIKRKMDSRAEELKSRGLYDENVIYDLVTSENPDLPEGYKKYHARIKEIKKRKQLPYISLIVILASVVTFLFVGFVFNFWHPGWLIIEGAVTFLIIGLLIFTVTRLNQNKWYPVSRILIGFCVMLFTQFMFLLLRIPFKYEKSYLVFIAAPALLLICDAILGTVTHQKLIVINYLLYVPGVFALIYAILGILGIIPWHPGWLIMIAAVLIDFAILLFVIKINRKYTYHPEVEDEWNND